jgi:hypothetical protein
MCPPPQGTVGGGILWHRYLRGGHGAKGLETPEIEEVKVTSTVIIHLNVEDFVFSVVILIAQKMTLLI